LRCGAADAPVQKRALRLADGPRPRGGARLARLRPWRRSLARSVARLKPLRDGARFAPTGRPGAARGPWGSDNRAPAGSLSPGRARIGRDFAARRVVASPAQTKAAAVFPAHWSR